MQNFKLKLYTFNIKITLFVINSQDIWPISMKNENIFFCVSGGHDCMENRFLNEALGFCGKLLMPLVKIRKKIIKK